MLKKTSLWMLLIILIFTACTQQEPAKPISTSQKETQAVNAGQIGTKPSYLNNDAPIESRVADLLSRMTMDEKIGQMVQAGISFLQPEDIAIHYLGSVLSNVSYSPGDKTSDAWKKTIDEYRRAANSTRLKIPVMFGINAVHGLANFRDAVIFPHNSALGAANDPDLATLIAKETAKQMLLSGITWNLAPCIDPIKDIRLGMTYESFSENDQRQKALSEAYIKGLQSLKVLAGPVHYVNNGVAFWNTKQKSTPQITNDLASYQAAIDTGSRTVTISESSITKSKDLKWIQKLKDQNGFTGFLVLDYGEVQKRTQSDFHEHIVKSINMGIDMLMEQGNWLKALEELKAAVQNGEISEQRINDAVSRILRVKFENGLFDDSAPQVCLDPESIMATNRSVARLAVQKSLVLLKNEGVLPLKKDARILVLGEAAENIGIQSGGWTMSWQGTKDMSSFRNMEGTTIVEGIKNIVESNGGKVYTYPTEATDIQAVILVLGETPYAGNPGNDTILNLYDNTALSTNWQNIQTAKATGLPVITVLVSGRPRIVTDDLPKWDAFVMAWLPGTEGQGVADALFGDSEFTGTLPFNWPKNASYFSGPNEYNILYKEGFGLTTSR